MPIRDRVEPVGSAVTDPGAARSGYTSRYCDGPRGHAWGGRHGVRSWTDWRVFLSVGSWTSRAWAWSWGRPRDQAELDQGGGAASARPPSLFRRVPRP